MKDVSCVDHLNFVQNVTNVPVVAPELPVLARLHQSWETWTALVASDKVITVLREGYTEEVKLIVLQKGIKIHRYLDGWLVRARSHQTCLQHGSYLGRLVNLDKL